MTSVDTILPWPQVAHVLSASAQVEPRYTPYVNIVSKSSQGMEESLQMGD